MMFKYMCLVLFITWYQLADCHPAKTSDLKSIDSMIDKESEAYLAVDTEVSSQKNVRDKRTVGFLRQLFPGISQMIDRKIQQITRFIFRVIGRLVLRGGAGGGGGGGGATGGNGGGAASSGGGGGGDGGRRISITLPTYPPSADDEDDETSTEVPATSDAAPVAPAAAAVSDDSIDSRSAASGTDAASVVSVTASSAATDPTPSASSESATDSAFAAADAVANTVAPSTAADAVVSTSTAADAVVSTSTAAVTTTTTTSATPTTQMSGVSENTVAVVKRKARDVSEEEAEDSSSQKKRSPLTDSDADVPASSDNGLSDTNSEVADDAEKAATNDDPRNKRFLLGAGGNGSGGSGNFVFDLIRLIAGSGANPANNEGTSASLEDAQEVHADANTKEDGYSVGVPGPLTRIFVIANRGVANLVQDLILRLAQTTERIVNFKARLITSLI